MVQQIQVNNEIIEFPDNMNDIDIETVLNKEFGQQPAQQPAFLDKILQLTQQLATGQPLKPVGEVLTNIPVGLGRTAVGATQAIAQLSGQEEFAQRLGQQVKKEREEEGEISGAAKAGRVIGETILPALVSPAGLIGGGVVGGAAIGATTPQEEDGGLRERGKEIAKGAAIGGLAGGVLRVGTAITKGIKGLIAAKKPEDILAQRLSPEKTTELLEQLKTATPDSPVLLPDIAGDEIKGLTRAVGKLGNGKDVVVEAIEGRSLKAVERVSNQLSKDVSNVDTYFGNLDDIAKARSKIAAPLYKKAFDRGTILDIKKNKKLFDKIKPDIRDARKKFRLDDTDIADNSIVMLDNAKKSLDDKISVAIRQGERQQAQSLLKIKNELVTKLDRLNPDYKKARQIFSDFSSVQNAQEQGLQFSKLRPEELQRLFKTLSVSEKEAFRIGVRENLQKTVSTTSEGADPAKRIFGNSFKRNQLRAIFPSRDKFKLFEKRMKEEIAAAETKFKVLGGSRTDINIANDAQFIETVSRIGGGAALGSKFAIINALVTSFRNRFAGISTKNAKGLANILVKKEKSIEALENILAKEKNAVQRRILTEAIKDVTPLITVQTTQQTGE